MPADDTGSVKIIVAGLPRTSTTSLKKGLEILGIGPCFHLGDPPAPIKRVKESARVLAIQDKKARQAALKLLYDGYEAIFEPPASVYVDDLLEIYPEAKVILSVRKDPQAWLASYCGMGIDLRSPVYRFLGYWTPGVIHSSDLIIAWAKVYQQRFGLPASQVPSAEMYYNHNQWVEGLVPHQKLLVYQASMGWGPLCKFLEKDEPVGVAFPRVNEAAFLRRVKCIAMTLGSVVWVLLFLLVAWLAVKIANFLSGA